MPALLLRSDSVMYSALIDGYVNEGSAAAMLPPCGSEFVVSSGSGFRFLLVLQ